MTVTVAVVVVLALHPVDTTESATAAIAIAGPLIAAGLLTTRCIDPQGPPRIAHGHRAGGAAH